MAERRVLIAIGCNGYDHLDELACGENDAQAIYKELASSSVGDYDDCKILLSPTSKEILACVDELLFGRPIDTFTFFLLGTAV